MRPALSPEQLRAYRDRDWGLVRAAKRASWAADARRRGPLAGLEVSTILWLHARAVDPNLPGPVHRARDLEHHILLAAKVRRVAHVFADR